MCKTIEHITIEHITIINVFIMDGYITWITIYILMGLEKVVHNHRWWNDKTHNTNGTNTPN